MQATTLEYPSIQLLTPIEPDLPCRVLRCATSREIEANRHLEARGFTTYLPTCQRVIHQGYRNQESVTRALLPGYVLIWFDDRDLNLVLDSPLIYNRLRFGRTDAVIDDAELARIRALSQLPEVQPWQAIPNGTKIRVTSGPLSGTQGILISRKPPLQVVVEVSLLNRWVKISIDGCSIERL